MAKKNLKKKAAPKKRPNEGDRIIMVLKGEIARLERVIEKKLG